MFYITDSAGYSPASGAPNISDGDTKPAPAGVTALLPSVVIDTGLLNSQFASLSDAGSPYNGMLIFQRRKDPWPIVLLQMQALLGGCIEGSIYAK